MRICERWSDTRAKTWSSDDPAVLASGLMRGLMHGMMQCAVKVRRWARAFIVGRGWKKEKAIRGQGGRELKDGLWEKPSWQHRGRHGTGERLQCSGGVCGPLS